MQEPAFRPPHDTWTVAVHRTRTDSQPMGTGVVVDSHRIITCAHVLRAEDAWLDEVWVSFPKAGVGRTDRRRVQRWQADHYIDEQIDLAVLELDSPVPATVVPARLRAVTPQDLQGLAWWAFGFPGTKPHGNDAYGTIGAVLGYGNLRLDTGSPYDIERGFSGGAVWAPDYDAVVGLVSIVYQGSTHRSGEALTLEYVDRVLPEIKLLAATAWAAEAADEPALAAWGWELRADPEAGRHWLPRSRGVAVDTERGYRFRGRRAALDGIVRWLDDPVAQQRVLVLTGSPGVGKSAVLGRIVTTSDREIRSVLPPDDDAVRATEGSVACAVHARGKTALDVTGEIARAAGIRLPAQPEDLLPALREHLVRRPRRFSLVIDALDETAGPADARCLLRSVLVPLVRAGTELDTRVVVGTRRSDDDGDLLGEFGADAEIIDLDRTPYLADSDLVAYAAATLQLVGAERIGNPYAEPTAAEPVARRIAALAGGNFLVAGLVARAHGLRDIHAVRPDEVSFTPTVGAALDNYLAALPPAGDTPAQLALTVLACAEVPGLPLPLWRVGVQTLGGAVTDDQLAEFARTSAANFVVESSTDRELRGYRLFHQSLNEVLLAGRSPRTGIERRLVEGWLAYGRAVGWERVPGYLLHALPVHARRAGLVDVLLTDDEYLLRADLRRLLAVADDARTEAGRARQRLLQMSSGAVDAAPAERAAMLSVVQALDNIDARVAGPASMPYRCRWASTTPRVERTVLDGHVDQVFTVCAVTVGGRQLLASAGADGRILLWDPATGQPERTIDAHGEYVRALCCVRLGRRVLLASAGEDGAIKVWDPGTGALERTVYEGPDWARALCAVPAGDSDTELIAAASDDGSVRLWDPATGSLVTELEGSGAWAATAVCTVPVDGRMLLVSAGNDGTVRLWDTHRGRRVHLLPGYSGAVCAVPVPGGNMVAFAGYDGVIRLAEPAPRAGAAVRFLRGHSGVVTSLCALSVTGRTLLASASEDMTIRLWNPVDGTVENVFKGHTEWPRSVCAVTVGERNLLASASDDGTVRLWDPHAVAATVNTGTGSASHLAVVSVRQADRVVSTGSDGSVRLWDPDTGEQTGVHEAGEATATALGAVTADSGPSVVIGAGDGRLRLWNPDTGERTTVGRAHSGEVTAISVFRVGGRDLVASADGRGALLIWDPTGDPTPSVPPLGERVTALCAAVEGPSFVLAAAGEDGRIRLWRPDDRRWVAPLAEHRGAVNALCAVPGPRGTLLASGRADGRIELWDPAGGTAVRTLKGHKASVTDLCVVPANGRGMLASVSDDRTARLWDVPTAATVRRIPVHHVPLACRFVAGSLIIGLDAGVMAVVLTI